MEENQLSSDNYRSSSSSSASSPVRRAPHCHSSFFYVQKPGDVSRTISYADSPDWDDTEIEANADEQGESIRITPNRTSPFFSKVETGSFPSPSLADASSAIQERKVLGASIVWKDLSVNLKMKGHSGRVVKASNGYALPGTITVIMGPAQSGKSTLLRAIAGRLHRDERMYGEVFINGLKSRLVYGSYGFVDRQDVLVESLTVREMICYSALLQLPSYFSQKKSLVEDAIAAMSLSDYADKLIGGRCCKNRIPRGERRRVSIARELVTRPHVLFIDEPLYHLDSVSALLLMVMLKRLASTGCTVIFTMYQSSTEVFGLFDRICLLSNGNTLFFGETLACLQHFSNAGFPCPIMQSPSDHFLRAINTDFDRIIAMCKNLQQQDDQGDFSSVSMDTAVAIQTLEATYRSSADSAAVETMIIKLTEKKGLQLKSKGRASDAARIGVLTWRSLLIMSRDWKYFWIRLALYITLALSIGTIFINIGHSLSSVMGRVSAIFAFVSFMILLSISGVPSHIDEIKVYTYEESNEHSKAAVFLLGHLFSSIPFIFLISVTSSLVFYFLLGLRPGFSFLAYFILNIFMCLIANEALMMIIAYVWLETFKSILTLVFTNVIMMLVSGYFRNRRALPEPVWLYPMSITSIHTYAVQGILENEYTGMVFPVGEIRVIPGVQAVRGSYDISGAASSKWVNLLALLALAAGYRLILFVLLHFHVRELVVGSLCRMPRASGTNAK